MRIRQHKIKTAVAAQIIVHNAAHDSARIDKQVVSPVAEE